MGSRILIICFHFVEKGIVRIMIKLEKKSLMISRFFKNSVQETLLIFQKKFPGFIPETFSNQKLCLCTNNLGLAAGQTLQHAPAG